ncbi:MAG: TldE/PmbA family protein, Actinobacterial subgroup, partial [uncultured Gemmatimonadaceae bacterium]
MSAPRSLFSAGAAPADALLTREQAQALAERVLKMSKAETAQLAVTTSYQGNTRFAANQMSTAGGVTNAQVAIQSSFGPKHAVVTTNDLSDDALRRAVEQSERLARLAPDDPEAMPALGPQQYAAVDAFFDRTAALTAGDRAAAAKLALDAARAAGDLQAAGFIVSGMTAGAIANSKGMFAYHRSTGG